MLEKSAHIHKEQVKQYEDKLAELHEQIRRLNGLLLSKSKVCFCSIIFKNINYFSAEALGQQWHGLAPFDEANPATPALMGLAVSVHNPR